MMQLLLVTFDYYYQEQLFISTMSSVWLLVHQLSLPMGTVEVGDERRSATTVAFWQ